MKFIRQRDIIRPQSSDARIVVLKDPATGKYVAVVQVETFGVFLDVYCTEPRVDDWNIERLARQWLREHPEAIPKL